MYWFPSPIWNSAWPDRAEIAPRLLLLLLLLPSPHTPVHSSRPLLRAPAGLPRRTAERQASRATAPKAPAGPSGCTACGLQLCGGGIPQRPSIEQSARQPPTRNTEVKNLSMF
ncbi:hypothetical protein PVAP13_8NG317084 [Panicum virgatum]|uniref:Secreted protein n=1 Tax=Panicum virgatum TaxID=38727 RepID=A0A8T0PG44_PANVG|nr:hypothetical protein PVAP13_8NG317084 [Panicum virgatum]